MPGCVGKADSFPPNTLEDVWRNKAGFPDILKKNNIDFNQLSLRVRDDDNRFLLCQLFGLTSGADEIEIALKVVGSIVSWDTIRTPKNKNEHTIWHTLGLLHEETEIETIDATGLTPSDTARLGDTSHHDTFIRPPRV